VSRTSREGEEKVNTTMDGFLKHFNNVRQRTRRVADCIPPEQIEWAPREGMFTLGDLVRHIAVTERYVWAETVHNRPSLYVSHGKELAEGKHNVLAFLDRMHEESLELFRGLPQEAMNTNCRTLIGAHLVTWKWLQMMTEHEAHHRGQLYTSLGCLGVETPSLYGLSSEEVRQLGAA
jgi:uncharacterized damage-inducible protein DinB